MPDVTWREALIARILLLLAQMFADDETLAGDLKNLSNHITIEGRKAAA